MSESNQDYTEALDKISNIVSDNSKDIDVKTVNWDDYDLDPSLRHLYYRAEVKRTPNGNLLVVMVDEFKWLIGEYNELGARMTEAVNGPDLWRIATVQTKSRTSGAVLLTRRIPLTLEWPNKIASYDFNPPADDSASTVEADSLQWMKDEGITTPEE